jgi:hypothetical protein
VVATAGEPLDIRPENPGHPVDVPVQANITALMKTWLGYRGLREAMRDGDISMGGSAGTRATLRALLDPRDAPYHKHIHFGPPH